MGKIFQSQKLVGVHPDLVRVVVRAADLFPFDLLVAEGVRTSQRQKTLYAQGRTAPGKVVTWTMKSKHLKQDDGFGHAVDLYTQTNGKLDTTKQVEIGNAMGEAARELGVNIRWGADWNHNGRPFEKGETDSPHFELKV
jgi:peptidoglycan L-alanyl-D-glutamate endopeptidase CwlK